MTKFKKILLVVVAALFIFFLVALARYRRAPSEIQYTRILMGTVVEITLAGDDEARLNQATEAAFEEIKRLEGLMSHYKAESDVSKINNSAGKKAVPVSKETLEVIEASISASKLTNGAFDVTMGVLGKVWHFTSDDRGEPVPPSAEEVKKLLPLINYRNIIIDTNNKTVKLAKQEMRINLGGIAKGYIVGKAIEVLKKQGIKRGIIHAGGDMIVFQEPEDKPWLIGIQHPREKDVIIGMLELYNSAVATSGDYERFFVYDNVRYHHIMEPSAGFPARKSMAVTIIAKDPTFADALSTSIFILGPEKGMKLIEDLPDVEGLIVDPEGKITVSSGLKGKIEEEL